MIRLSKKNRPGFPVGPDAPDHGGKVDDHVWTALFQHRDDRRFMPEIVFAAPRNNDLLASLSLESLHDT
jgi:hypothetical protein